MVLQYRPERPWPPAGQGLVIRLAADDTAGAGRHGPPPCPYPTQGDGPEAGCGVPPRDRRSRRGERLIAVVDNDSAFLQMMNVLLLQEGYQTLLWPYGRGAHEMIRREEPDLVILDLRLGDLESGWTTLEQLRLDPRTARVPVILCSADVRFLREKAETLRRHRCDVLEKPFELDDLLAKVRAFIGPPSPADRRPAP